MAAYSIHALNALTQTDFVACLSDIYEHSPWLAECADWQRPFASVASLAAAMQACVERADQGAQLALIRVHPELTGKLAMRGELTTSSQAEQAAAGLNNCTEAEFTALSQLNHTYQQKFNFPFIVAVRGMNRIDIISAMTQRLTHTTEQEIDAALRQIGRIAQFRLNDLITD